MLVLVAACGGDAEPRAEATGDSLAAGSKAYGRTCAACHGPKGEGTRLLGKDLRRNEFVHDLTDAELSEFIRRGRPATHPLNERGVAMPPRGGDASLADAEIDQIVVYLRSLG